ncbi:MAG TPA: hypothetical protein PKM71_07950 [Candidatus Cloacimonas sp.]|nr:hypothetical protein [Candidatus Cloacimonas sp.]
MELGNTARETEVSREMLGLEKALNRVGEKINQLRERLSPILSPKPCGVEKSQTTPASCPLAEKIKSFKTQTDCLCGNIVSILEDLEL